MIYDSGMDPGALIRDARHARGIDQSTLARRAGTTQTYVSKVERGKVSPTLSTLTRLLRAMGLELELDTRPLSSGNVSSAALQSDYRNLTASDRVQQATELSEFLTGVSASAPAAEPA